MARRPVITPREIAKRAARLADDMRATEIVVLDVRKLSDIADFFVIATADNRRQLRAIQGRLSEELPKLGTPRPHVEGELDSSWILIDAYDLVVHLFDPEARRFYDLELLWGDAPKVNWQRAASK